jgi:hypothetical protein
MTARSCLVLAALVLLLGGCESGPKAVPVSGNVTLDGKPLPGATVQFVPVAAPDGKAPPPSAIGTTDQTGRYSLVFNTNGNTTGAAAGKYRVMITLGGQGGTEETTDAKSKYQKQLPGRYNRKTTLECDIPAEGRDDANFALTSSDR